MPKLPRDAVMASMVLYKNCNDLQSCPRGAAASGRFLVLVAARIARRAPHQRGECQGSCRLNSVMISSYRRCRCACGVDVWRCGLPTGDECATVLTAEKVRCSPASPCSRATERAARGCGWLCSSHLLLCAPRLGRCQVGTGKQARRSNRKAGFVRLPPG